MSEINNGKPEKETKKMLLLGLDNSGKSSILLILTRKSNLLNFLSLTPTHRYNITNYETNGKIFNLWDFGGQERYRNEYLTNIDKYFVDIDKLFYVIDVQDKQRYDLALDYLKKILKFLKDTDEKFEFTIFLHKYDPNIHEISPKIDEVIRDNLIPRIQEVVPPNFSYHIYRTSIFTMFSKELVI